MTFLTFVRAYSIEKSTGNICTYIALFAPIALQYEAGPYSCRFSEIDLEKYYTFLDLNFSSSKLHTCV